MTKAMEYLPVRHSYIAVEVEHDGCTWLLAGKLNYPNEGVHGGAVLIVHGSGGVDTRGEMHSRALNDVGFVTLEIDLWAARGWVGPSVGRPQGVLETLPDALAARDYLASVPGVDAQRIGIVGFSWGGVVTMLTRNRPNLETYGPSPGFAACVAFYPICWLYNVAPGYELDDLVAAPLLVLTGAADDYDEPDTCDLLRASLKPADQQNMEVVVYPDAAHAFNTSNPSIVVNDPSSHSGAGGEVLMQAQPEARAAANAATTQFFIQHIGTAK